jgi:hypothetical protein
MFFLNLNVLHNRAHSRHKRLRNSSSRGLLLTIELLGMESFGGLNSNDNEILALQLCVDTYNIIFTDFGISHDSGESWEYIGINTYTYLGLSIK